MPLAVEGWQVGAAACWPNREEMARIGSLRMLDVEEAGSLEAASKVLERKQRPWQVPI